MIPTYAKELKNGARHAQNADLFLKTVCVSLAFPSELQFEPKVRPFTYGPLYCPDTFDSDKNLPFPLLKNSKQN
jgi:hypothetical protein